MKTLEQELTELQAKTAKTAADLAAKHEVLQHLPDIGEYAPPSVQMLEEIVGLLRIRQLGPNACEEYGDAMEHCKLALRNLEQAVQKKKS